MLKKNNKPSSSQKLLIELKKAISDTAAMTGINELQQKTIDAYMTVDRSQFVPDHERSSAWDNHPLSIGYQQTISQPYIVVLMTELLDISPHHRVLEVGTGSGYQTAFLARLAGKVYTIERIPELAISAKERFSHLHFSNIISMTGNGFSGWPENAPFDRIIVTAAPETIPQKLVNQLAPGGLMVIPYGIQFNQTLAVVTNLAKNGAQHQEFLVDDKLAVSFVPMIDAQRQS